MLLMGEQLCDCGEEGSRCLQKSTGQELTICLDPRDLNEALEREPYYTDPLKRS